MDMASSSSSNSGSCDNCNEVSSVRELELKLELTQNEITPIGRYHSMSTRRRKKSPTHEMSDIQLHPISLVVNKTQSPCQKGFDSSMLNNYSSRNKDHSLTEMKNPKLFVIMKILPIVLASLLLIVFYLHFDNSIISHDPYYDNSKRINTHEVITNMHVPYFKRIVIYSEYNEVRGYLKSHLHDKRRRKVQVEIDDPMLHVNLGEETIAQPIKGSRKNNCVPMQKWQIANYPTCNNVHELNLQHLQTTTRHERKRSRLQLPESIDSRDSFQILGRGWFRHTWKGTIGIEKEVVVIKTLRFERDYLSEYYDLHRRESIAMERLTPSPYIIDIYSFCGQTAVNEYANFIDGFQDFKTFAKQLKNKNGKVLYLKLQIAAMIALGVQHIHEIDGNLATMAHYDINPMNIAITAHGVPKINDFNVAEFMYWDKEKNTRCGFEGRFHEPWWRSPEEMLWAENYNNDTQKLPLLDGHTPRGPTRKERMKVQADQIKKGIPPIIDQIYATSDEPAVVALREAVNKCYEPDPRRRSSARDIASGLLKVLHMTRSTQYSMDKTK